MLVKKTKLFAMISALFLVILSACHGDIPPVVLTIDFDTNGEKKSMIYLLKLVKQ